jgi:hypothetical protein
MSALSCIVPWLARVEADHLAASCEGNAVSAQHSGVACVGLTPLQDVVGFVKSPWVPIVTIKVAVAKVSKIRVVVGIRAANEPYHKTHFLTGHAIGVVWDCLTIRTPIAIPNCNVIDKCLVGDTYANFVQHLHLSEEQLVIALQRHVFSLVEAIKVFLHIRQCVSKETTLLKAVGKSLDDLKQSHTVVVGCWKVFM